MRRLFFALPLPPHIKDLLVAQQAGIPGARWVTPENMHLTLCFLGDTDGVSADLLCEAVSQIQVQSFDLQLEGVNTFSSRGETRVLWVGIKKEEKLFRLQKKIAQLARQEGLPIESRKYTPHITIARLKECPSRRVGEYLTTHNIFTAPSWEIAGFSLFSSHFTKQGNVYCEEAEFTFKRDT